MPGRPKNSKILQNEINIACDFITGKIQSKNKAHLNEEDLTRFHSALLDIFTFQTDHMWSKQTRNENFMNYIHTSAAAPSSVVWQACITSAVCPYLLHHLLTQNEILVVIKPNCVYATVDKKTFLLYQSGIRYLNELYSYGYKYSCYRSLQN